MGKFNPLNAKLKLVPISASSARYFNHHSEHAQAITWEPCNSIASQERPAVLRTCPIGFKDTRLCFFSKLVLNLPLPRGEKERTEVHKQVYTWNKHQGEEGGGLETPYLLFCRELQHSLLCFCSVGGPPHTSSTTFFLAMPRKSIFNGNSPGNLSKLSDTYTCH